MIDLKGVIFDVDDTLLNNETRPWPLHQQSRLDAVKAVAGRLGLTELMTLTPEQNAEASQNAKIHSAEGGIWSLLYLKGVVDSEVPDLQHPIVREIAAEKEARHADVLRQRGREVIGAIPFVDSLLQAGMDNLAIASMGSPRDIDIFLREITVLGQFFPHDRIISKADIPQNKAKPHPEPYNRAFSLLGLSDADRRYVLAIEDDPRGIRSAKAAGLYACAITTRFAKTDERLLISQPDLVVESYTELAEHLGLPNMITRMETFYTPNIVNRLSEDPFS